MRSTESVITEIVEAYNGRFGQWVRITEIAEKAGLTRDELTEALTDLMNDEDFRAEPEPFGHRITAADKAIGPVIGGEARHLICWY